MCVRARVRESVFVRVCVREMEAGTGGREVKRERQRERQRDYLRPQQFPTATMKKPVLGHESCAWLNLWKRWHSNINTGM